MNYLHCLLSKHKMVDQNITFKTINKIDNNIIHYSNTAWFHIAQYSLEENLHPDIFGITS